MNKLHWKIIILFILSTTYLGCSGGSQSSQFSSLSATEIDYITPSSVSAIFANFYQGNNESTTEVADQLSLSNSLSIVSGLAMPPKNTFSGKYMLHFLADGSRGLESGGISPGTSPLLLTEFSFLLVAKFAADGVIFSYGATGSNDDQVKLTLATNNLTLSHQSSDGNYQSRTYDITNFMNQNVVVGIVAGKTGKDIELYLNGFRLTQFTSSSAGAVADFNPVLRMMTLGGTGSGNFYFGQLISYARKLDPKTMYQISKYISSSWGIGMQTALTSEIRTGKMPMIEPIALTYTYIAALIITPKCATCHNPSGSYPGLLLDSYSNIMAAVSAGQSVVSPGNSAISRMYIRAASTTAPMPANNPLSATEIEYIKSWIDQGAPQ